MIIAQSARRTNGAYDGLKAGQCHLGGHKNYEMTEKEYRYAKKILVENGLIKIIATSKTVQKRKRRIFLKTSNCENGADVGAIELTTTGTLVELCDSTIWDINSEEEIYHKGDQKGGCGAVAGRLKGDKQECKEREEREEKKDIAQPAKKRLRSKDSLSFDFDSWKFTGITESDMEDWKKMYSSIDLDVEILKAAHWLRDNPSKSKKTLWRKYLTGWLKRSNEWLENKKAYQGAKTSPQQDRRTKDVNGSPVENQYQERF
jgi:hypothetical protein